jgi:Tfp pilus assembly protein PilF
MARAFYRPTGENTPAAMFFHKTSATHYSILQREGKFFERRWQIGFQGSEENAEELQIDYVMGSGNHVRTYLHRTARGTLIELPLAWYAEKGGEWTMNPGYDTTAPDTRRKIGYDCMFCHNGYPEIPAGHDTVGSEPVFARLPEGIDCQRCHGPGSEHVRVAQNPGAKKEALRAAILNPARLTPERQMEVCMQCHLETTSRQLPGAIKRFDRPPFSYRPDEPLGSFVIFFDHAPGSGREGKFEIVSSAYRLRQSRCFLASAGKLTCETCHNPHDIPRGDAAVRHYVQVCRSCHASNFDALVQSNRHVRDADCIACHMPKRRAEDVVHAVMTDHLIQRRKPTSDLVAELAERNENEAARYHGEVVAYYPRNADALYVAVAQVAEKSNLDPGTSRLEAEIERQHPARIDFYIALGDGWRDRNDARKSIGPYEEALRRDPDSATAMRRLAIALKDAGDLSRAREILQRAVQVAPEDPRLWFELGSLDSDQGRNAQAIEELGKATSLDPDLAEGFENLGAALAESGQLDRAQAAFRSALRIRPYDARAYANLGKVLVQADTPQAQYCFEKALALGADWAGVHFDYGVLLARLNRLNEGQKQIESALRVDPRMAEAHVMLGGIWEMKGNTTAAEREYREALRVQPQFDRAQFNLGALLIEKGELDNALQYLQAAAQSRDAQISSQAQDVLRKLKSAPHR